MSVTIDLKAEIKKLVIIQEIDAEIFELISQKEAFPIKLQEIDAFVETRKTGLKAAEDELKKCQVEKKDKENDLKSSEDKIKKDEGGLALIKTNKEYKAMLDQIASSKADISLLEEKIIGLFDKIADAEKNVLKEKAAFEEENKKFIKEKEEIKAEEKKIDERLSKLAHERENSVKHIDQEIFDKYNRILKMRGKTALSKLNEEFCGECNIRLRAQVLNEVRLMRSLVMCENCSRILYPE